MIGEIILKQKKCFLFDFFLRLEIKEKPIIVHFNPYCAFVQTIASKSNKKPIKKNRETLDFPKKYTLNALLINQTTRERNDL